MGEYVSTQMLVIHHWAGPSVIALSLPIPLNVSGVTNSWMCCFPIQGEKKTPDQVAARSIEPNGMCGIVCTYGLILGCVL